METCFTTAHAEEGDPKPRRRRRRDPEILLRIIAPCLPSMDVRHGRSREGESPSILPPRPPRANPPTVRYVEEAPCRSHAPHLFWASPCFSRSRSPRHPFSPPDRGDWTATSFPR